MCFPFIFIHLFGHTAHHGPAWIFPQFVGMIPDPSPVQPIPNITPLALLVMAHLANV